MDVILIYAENIVQNNSCEFLVLIIAALAVIGKISRFTFFDLLDIIRNYLKCFGKIPIITRIFMFVMLVVLSAETAFFNPVNENMACILLMVLPFFIIVCLLIVVILIRLKDKFDKHKEISSSRYNNTKILINETFHISMFSVMVIVFAWLLSGMDVISGKYGNIDSAVLYLCLFVFVLNLLIILTRISVLIDEYMRI